MEKLRQVYQAQRTFFDERAANWVFPLEDQAKIKKILAELTLQPGMRLLDVGCGTGSVATLITKENPAVQVIGIDMAFEMLRRCDKQAITSGFIQAYCEQLPFKTATFDVILNYCVFPHIKNQVKSLREYRRVLRPHGRVLLIHPDGRLHTNCKHQEIGFPVKDDLLPEQADLVALFSRENFQVAKVIDTQELFYLEARKR